MTHDLTAAIEVTLDRAASAADRAYHLRKEEEADALDEMRAHPASYGAYWKAAFEGSERTVAELRAKVAAMDETIQKLRASSAIADLVKALEEIKALRSEPIGDTGFSVGPAALLGAAKRIARAALEKARQP